VKTVDGEKVDTAEEAKCTDWKRFHKAVCGACTEQGPSGMVVVEGFKVLADSQLVEMASFIFHLDLDRETLIARRTAKHIAERPNPGRTTKKYAEQCVWAAHNVYIKEYVEPLVEMGKVICFNAAETPFEHISEQVAHHVTAGGELAKRIRRS